MEKRVGRVRRSTPLSNRFTGIAKSVHIEVGLYDERTNLFVVKMYDFKFILGLEFL